MKIEIIPATDIIGGARGRLTQGGYAQLYPRTRRDAIISYGVVHQLPLGEINDKLFAEQEKTLF